MKTYDELRGEVERSLDKLEIAHSYVGKWPGQFVIVAMHLPLAEVPPEEWRRYIIGVWEMHELDARSPAEVLDLVRQRVKDWKTRRLVGDEEDGKRIAKANDGEIVRVDNPGKSY